MAFAPGDMFASRIRRVVSTDRSLEGDVNGFALILLLRAQQTLFPAAEIALIRAALAFTQAVPALTRRSASLQLEIMPSGS